MSYASERPARTGAVPPITGWVGVVVFGGVMMVLLGLFHLFEGLVAFLNDDYFAAPPGDLAVNLSYNGWGWLHVVIGLLCLATGTGIFLGRDWARLLGVVIALASAFISLIFVPAYPVWSVILILVSVLVIYALAAHGREVRA